MAKPIRRHCRRPDDIRGSDGDEGGDDDGSNDISNFIRSGYLTDDHAIFEGSIESIDLQIEPRGSTSTAKHHMNTSYGHFFFGLDVKRNTQKSKAVLNESSSDDEYVSDDDTTTDGDDHDVTRRSMRSKNIFLDMAYAESSALMLRCQGAKSSNRLLQIVLVVLVIIIIVVPQLVYFFWRAREIQAFETEFKSLALVVMDNFSVKLARVLSGADALSVTSTSLGMDAALLINQRNRMYKEVGRDGTIDHDIDHDRDNNMYGLNHTDISDNSTGPEENHTMSALMYRGIGNERLLAEGTNGISPNEGKRKGTTVLWPFVTLNHFELFGASSVTLANALQVAINPLVTNETHDAWEKFTVENIDWLYDAQRREAELRSDAEQNYDGHMDHTNQTSTTQNGTAYNDTENLSSQFDVRRFLQHDHDDQSPASSLQLNDHPPNDVTPVENVNGINSRIFRIDPHGENGISVDYSSEPFFPVWQVYPLSAKQINYNPRSMPALRQAIDAMTQTQSAAIGSFLDFVGNSSQLIRSLFQDILQARSVGGDVDWEYFVSSVLVYPIFDTFETDNRSVVGAATIIVVWNSFFESLLPENSNSVICELENTCGESQTFEVRGRTAKAFGRGMTRNEDFEYLHEHYDFSDMQHHPRVTLSDTAVELDSSMSSCRYVLHILPTEDLHGSFRTNLPWIVALITGLFFSFIAVVLSIYACVVSAASKKAIQVAQKNGEIVSSIYPEQVLHRVRELTREKNRVPLKQRSCRTLKADDDITLLRENREPRKKEETFETINASPLADSYAHCTVFFAFLDGFDTWSLSRDPEEIFILLEGVFQAMDKCARRRDVFKVETIGESYMAVTGLPEAQEDHVLRMARFAREAMDSVHEILTKNLSKRLGDDTNDLALKIGMHSGSVTAGLLRGEKARFQLFGDTVNTASRMATLGKPGKIQLSEPCSMIIVADGKDRWLKRREDQVTVKGKGIVKTYWLRQKRLDQFEGSLGKSTRSIWSTSSGGCSFSSPSLRRGREPTGSILGSLDEEGKAEEGKAEEEEDLLGQGSFASGGSIGKEVTRFNLPDCVSVMSSSSISDDEDELEKEKQTKLAKWLSDILTLQLESVVEQHNAIRSKKKALTRISSIRSEESSNSSSSNDIVESFQMPGMISLCMEPAEDESIEVTTAVKQQLMGFVEDVAARYPKCNHYHNFEHAVHATLSSIKLLSSLNECRKKKKSNSNKRGKRRSVDNNVRSIGIAKDPLARFAVVVSALVHDIDHAGIPSQDIATARPGLAKRYKFRSVAQQHSMDVAWKLLMQSKNKKLHTCIFGDTDREGNMQRFRQFMVNFVLATDIYDSGALRWRQMRWNKAFHEQTEPETALPDDSDAKVTRDLQATVIMESIVISSDLSYAMQHWTVYRKWSERLFSERIAAYECGRIKSDPAATWQAEQLHFFDNLIIPLTRRLRDSGVFRLSIEACHTYALENRMLVEKSGHEILAGMLARYHWRKNNAVVFA